MNSLLLFLFSFYLCGVFCPTLYLTQIHFHLLKKVGTIFFKLISLLVFSQRNTLLKVFLAFHYISLALHKSYHYFFNLCLHTTLTNPLEHLAHPRMLTV